MCKERTWNVGGKLFRRDMEQWWKVYTRDLEQRWQMKRKNGPGMEAVIGEKGPGKSQLYIMYRKVP